jgi:cephalosporin hydroxylase
VTTDAYAEEIIAKYGALQKPAELAALMRFLNKHWYNQPLTSKIIVEIGCDAGGTLFLWRKYADTVIGISLPAGPFSAHHDIDTHGARVLLSDSHDPLTFKLLVTCLEGQPIDLLFIDGDHSYNGVKQDYEMYSPLVRSGGIVSFHDICHHNLSGVGVEQFWGELNGNKHELIGSPKNWGGIGLIIT